MEQPGPWEQPASLLIVIAAVALVSFGVADLRKGRRTRGAWMLVGGFLMVAIPVGATFALNAYREWASWERTVWVQGLEVGGEPEFTVDIRHQGSVVIYTVDSERLEAEAHSFTYPLWDAGDLDDVVATFQEQHPDGVRDTTPPFGYGAQESVWHVYVDGARYDLFDNEVGSFTVATQVALVEKDEEAEPALIPFPSGSSPEALWIDVTTYLSNLTMEEWREFYGPIEGVTITDSTIAIPASDGSTVSLTFAEYPEESRLGFTITVSD